MLGAAFLAASFPLHECSGAENAARFFRSRVNFFKKNRGVIFENLDFILSKKLAALSALA